MTVITRFAPSPTGDLHIGGLRTALFNWLHARHHGGLFLLRIEDTDQKRSTPEALQSILDGLAWCGLDADHEPVYQSKRLKRHQEIAAQLLATRKAYHCYSTAEELQTMRQKARAQGKTVSYDGRWRDRDPATAPKDIAPTLRLRTPLDGTTAIKDIIQGEVQTTNDHIDDMILLRADGTPTYMLSVVVDDHDMGVSDIIRGDDHLTNALRQYHIYEALDWPKPNWAHIPLIHGADGKKLSKRHRALSVLAWRDMGFLSQALANYLVRLGWSHGNDEIIAIDQAIQWFDFHQIKRAAAKFDQAKLEHLNAHYLREKSAEDLLDLVEPFFTKTLSNQHKNYLISGMDDLKTRARTLLDLVAMSSCFVQTRPLEVERKAVRFLSPENKSILRLYYKQLTTIDPWDAERLEALCRDFSSQHDIALKHIAQPLRAAITGKTISPPIFSVMAILGRYECLARLDDILD